MPGGGQPWKTALAQALGASLGFPQPPTALGKRYAFPTFPQRRRLFFFLSKQPGKDPQPIDPSITILQAHPSMRICSLEVAEKARLRFARRVCSCLLSRDREGVGAKGPFSAT